MQFVSALPHIPRMAVFGITDSTMRSLAGNSFSANAFLSILIAIFATIPKSIIDAYIQQDAVAMEAQAALQANGIAEILSQP